MAPGQSLQPTGFPVQNQVNSRSLFDTEIRRLSNTETRRASTSSSRPFWQPYSNLENSNYHHIQNQVNQPRAAISCYPPLYSEEIMQPLQTSFNQNLHEMTNNYPAPMQPIARTSAWHHNTFRAPPTSSLADGSRRPSTTGLLHSAVQNLLDFQCTAPMNLTADNFPVNLQSVGPWHHHIFRSPTSYIVPSSIARQVQNSIHSGRLSELLPFKQNTQPTNLPGLEHQAYLS